jgi:hypothetical protein
MVFSAKIVSVILGWVDCPKNPFCRRPRMARSHSHGKAEAFRLYLEGVAKKIADDLWGPKGPAWGTTLTELENVAVEAREIFSQKLLELGVARQSAALLEQRSEQAEACPSCQRSFTQPAQPSPRTMDTEGGEIHWQEPQEYCPRCRRAFFPSKPKPGH